MQSIRTYYTSDAAYAADKALHNAHIPCAIRRTPNASDLQWEILVWPRHVETALQILKAADDGAGEESKERVLTSHYSEATAETEVSRHREP